jgi:hypothetical protein
MPEGCYDREYVDDETIPADTELWRRIRPEQVVSGQDGRPRPSSLNFKDRRDRETGLFEPLSVYIAAEAGSVDALLAGHVGYLLVAITAREVRGQGRGIVRDDPDGSNAGHCVLFIREHRQSRGADKQSEKLARAARWVVAPA